MMEDDLILDESLSARRAWIEIVTRYRPTPKPVVALRKESVDRNANNLSMLYNAEKVALRKESVDRNFYYADMDADWVRSLSARRAWIEMKASLMLIYGFCVALRKESVDRNFRLPKKNRPSVWSLSARRAWIEI